MLFLKTVPCDAGESAKREIRALKTLDHPSIPRLYRAYEYSGGTAIWMTYFCGDTLGDRYRRGEHFSLMDIIGISLMLCDVIGYMHSEAGGRLCHLDLHPDNLILSSGRICIIDYGNSCRAGEKACFCGTPQFSAPELFYGGIADERSDVYSLGKIILWMLSAIEENDFRHKDVRALCLRCVRENPDYRFQSIAEFMESLEVIGKELLLQKQPFGER